MRLLEVHPALRPYAALMARSWANAAETCFRGLRRGGDELMQAVDHVQDIVDGRVAPKVVEVVESLDTSRPCESRSTSP